MVTQPSPDLITFLDAQATELLATQQALRALVAILAADKRAEIEGTIRLWRILGQDLAAQGRPNAALSRAVALLDEGLAFEPSASPQARPI